MPKHSIDQFINEMAAAEDLYYDYFRDQIPSTQQPPQQHNLAWLKTLTERDLNFQSLNQDDQRLYWNCMLMIERKVSFLTPTGATLRLERRLYLSFLMTRLLFKLDPSVVDTLNSVVVYTGSGKIRKAHDEGGFITIEGPMMALTSLIELELFLAKIFELFDSLARTDIPAIKSIAKKLRDWKNEIHNFIRAIKKSQSISIIKLNDLLSEIQNQKELFKPLEELVEEGQFSNLEAALADCVARVNERVVALENWKPKQQELQRTSIHLAWVSVVTSESTTNYDIVCHEIAHFVHSHFDLEHFLTSRFNHRSQASKFASEIEGFYSRFQNGEFAFLNDYARKNPNEFFAVCSEFFFTETTVLATGAPEIHKFLFNLYGYYPKSNPKKSSFWTLKTLILGPLSMFREV